MERYSTFWRRLGAGIFDRIILLPIPYLALKYVDLENPNSVFSWSVIMVFCYILYSVLLTGLAGQTIGKIVMGIKVLDLDEKNVIGIKRAFYRESVPFILQICGLLFIGYQVFGQRSLNTKLNSFVSNVIDTASYYWFIAELVTMFLNRKRRAVHDFLASSVVIGLKGERFDKHYEELEAKRNLQHNIAGNT